LKPVTVNVPPGTTDGGKLRFKGKGEPGSSGGPPGDLYVVTHIKPHRFFKREGADVIIELPVSLAEAALGTEVTVPAPDATKVKLKVPAGTQDAKVLRVRGKGAPKLSGKGNGDLKVRVRVVVPTELTDEQQHLFEELKAAQSEDLRAHLV
jgi:curved DNA-binding protein